MVCCRGEKKVISGKTLHKSAVTCITWPSSQSNYVVGLADGKVLSSRICILYAMYMYMYRVTLRNSQCFPKAVGDPQKHSQVSRRNSQ